MQRRGMLLTGLLLALGSLAVSADDGKSGDSLNKIDTGFFLLLEQKDPPQQHLNKIDTGFFLLLDPKDTGGQSLNKIDTGFFLLLDRKDEIAADEAELGRQLFFDPRLSANRSMSCATCHDPGKAFSDGRARARGLLGNTLPVGSSRVDLQACKLEYSIVSPK